MAVIDDSKTKGASATPSTSVRREGEQKQAKEANDAIAKLKSKGYIPMNVKLKASEPPVDSEEEALDLISERTQEMAALALSIECKPPEEANRIYSRIEELEKELSLLYLKLPADYLPTV